MVGVIAVATIIAVPVGYRVWAYYGWMEYKLICWDRDYRYHEIYSPATPELQDAIDDYFAYLKSERKDRDDLYYREGEQFYIRPWYYFDVLQDGAVNTILITHLAHGASLADAYNEVLGTHICQKIFENPKLFVSDPSNDYPTSYIYSQDYLSLLSFLAPVPERR